MNKKRFKKMIICVLMAALLLGGYIGFNEGIRPTLMAQGEAILKNKAIGIMNTAVHDVLNNVGDTSGLLHVEKDAAGKIAMISTDTATINKIANQCAIAAREEFVDIEESYIAVPLGNILGSKLFTGQGPKIRIKIQPTGAASAGFFTEFEAAGINQTRYKIYVVLQAYMKMISGAITQSVTVETKVLISEAIIVGEVPDTYANVATVDDFLNLVP